MEKSNDGRLVGREYRVQSLFMGQWVNITRGPLMFCRGYLDAKSEHSPMLAHRILRSDGKVVEELEAEEDVSVGMIAGWPTAGQYEAAAQRALDKAKAIREAGKKWEKRFAPMQRGE